MPAKNYLDFANHLSHKSGLESLPAHNVRILLLSFGCSSVLQDSHISTFKEASTNPKLPSRTWEKGDYNYYQIISFFLNFLFSFALNFLSFFFSSTNWFGPCTWCQQLIPRKGQVLFLSPSSSNELIGHIMLMWTSHGTWWGNQAHRVFCHGADCDILSNQLFWDNNLSDCFNF